MWCNKISLTKLTCKIQKPWRILVGRAEDGSIYSDYPMLPFDFEEVKVVDYKGEQIISNYDGLKEWWEDEK